ncbi:unnamed protein product [Bubo scandiacus]
MPVLGQLLVLLVVGEVAGGHGAPRDTLTCTQGLVCRLLDTDVLCGTESPGRGRGLALARLWLEPALRCTGPVACSPCLEVRLRLAVPPGTSTDKPHRPVPSGIPGAEDGGEGKQGSPVEGATLSQPNITGVLLLSGHAYAFSRCVAIEVWAPLAPALPGRSLGWVTFRCFEAPLGSELHVTAYTNSRGHRRLSRRQWVPDCSWPAAQAAVPQCQVPRLQVSLAPKEVVVEVQGAAAGHSYTLRLYHNQSHSTSGPERAVTASSPMNYSLPADEVLPCLCLQVWSETQDPLRATLCPFSHDVEAWERLWVRSRLVLHVVGSQALTCSLSAPCDLPAELVPCWQPVPAGPCQALPGLQQPTVGQGHQEFGGLRPHPNLCVQVWSGGQVRLIQCLRDREYCWGGRAGAVWGSGWGVTPPGFPSPPPPRPLAHPQERCRAAPTTSCCWNTGGTLLCAPWSGGACTPLASFTSTGAGHPGLLEQELRRDVAAGQCRQVSVGSWRAAGKDRAASDISPCPQIWHPENSTGVTLWACPLHKYLRARWALVWMGVLLGAACLLLLLLLKKEDVKGWLKSLRADYGSEGPLRGQRTLLVHAAEPVAERAACALMAALRPLGLARLGFGEGRGWQVPGVTCPWGEESGTAQGGPTGRGGVIGGSHACAAAPPPSPRRTQGLERTEHEGFGGGNTAWEEEKLAKYQHSETRLLEVLEGVCAPSDFACHQLLERSEEHVEQWWFHERQQHPDFFQWLCVDRLALCCLPGTYGPDCQPCAGGPQQPCSGNGRCDGDGTRRGTGLCVCSPGYGGPFCAECGDGYYEASRNKSHLVCAECYRACGRCTGPEDSSCLRCKRGWVLHEHRCIDIDECGTEMAHCRANQFCVNTEGSYECRDCSTACIGCMGAGPARCKKCNKGYWRDGAKCLDVDECASAEEPVCMGAQEVCENTEGSYRCVCARGHVRRDGHCVEDKPPDAPEKGFFDDVTEDEVVVLQQMFFGVMICALATLAAKGDMVFTAIFIGAVAAMAGYWLSDRSDRVLDGFMKGR